MLDLVGADTLGRAARRWRTSRASCASRRTGSRRIPSGSLGGFVDYLDAYQEAGGDLPTSVELSEDVEGVRLMTLYQAKGLEFPIVVVPQLLKDEWPAREGGAAYFPKELLREPIPGGDIHAEEERRLLYVAHHPRPRDAHAHHPRRPAAHEEPSRVRRARSSRAPIGEVEQIDRADSWADPDRAADQADATDGAAGARARRVMPLPSRARAAARRCACAQSSSSACSRGPIRPTPEGAAAQAALVDELEQVGRAVGDGCRRGPRRGLDPLTLREVTLD